MTITLSTSRRAEMEALTTASLRDIVRFARMNAEGISLGSRLSCRAEAARAIEILNDRFGLHPNWRRLHLGHLRQLRSFMRAPWNRHRVSEYRRLLKTAQLEAAAARQRAFAAIQCPPVSTHKTEARK